MSGNDLDLSSGNLVITDDRALCIAQKLTIRFQLFFGEWFADARIGVPYYQVILVKNPSMRVISTVFRQVIMGTEGVAEILSEDLNLDVASRTLTADYKIQTDTGAVIVGGVGKPFIVEMK